MFGASLAGGRFATGVSVVRVCQCDGVSGVLGQVEAAVDGAVVAGPVWSLSDGEVAGEVGQVFTVMQKLSARFAALLQDAGGRQIPQELGAANLTAWLTSSLSMSGAEASRWAKLAKLLPQAPVAAQALAAGEVSVEQARMIAQTVADLPREVGEQGKARAAEALTKLAIGQRLRPEVLGKHRAMILELVAPEIAEDRLRKDLERAERSAFERREFTLSPYGEGEYRARGVLNAEMAAVVNAALDPLSAPRTPTPTGADAAATAAAGDDDVLDRPAGSALGTQPDMRSAGARRADALIEICRRILDAGELPDSGGEKPHLVVTLSWQQLRDQIGHGLLDTGDLLTPATMRRLACDAVIIPAVLGGDGQVLDVGRARRLIDGPLRRALVLRDKGCAFPGCDRPARWCHGHHVRSWADGGDTSLANSALLCGFHHREIHHGGWQVHIAADGHPEFTPPAYVDPQRRPVRNTLHRRC